MTDKEKLDKLTLIDLLDDITKKYRFDAWENTDKIAEYLMVNGVTVQKQGRWEEHKPTGFLCCSTCKDVYINSEWLVDGKWNYCPNCGAKMEGDND